MTPESTVKTYVDSMLKEHNAYKHKPVQNGMGNPALDYHVCAKGCYAGIETKKEGATFTVRQARTAREIIRAGGAVFLVNSTEGAGFMELKQWLASPTPGFLGPHTANHLTAIWLRDTVRIPDDEPSND
jgi:hypothetical protein